MLVRAVRSLPLFRIFLGAACAATALSFGVAPAAASSGFASSDQSAEAMGLGGAGTARITPAAPYYNPGAAAFFGKTAQAAGTVWRVGRSLAYEDPSTSTEPGGTFDLQDPDPVAVHGFTIHPLSEKLNLAVSTYSPFHLQTEYTNPNTFPGREISLASTIRTLDVSTVASMRFGRKFGFGVGAVVRTTTFDMTRRVQTEPTSEPASADFAELEITSDPEVGFGVVAGFLWRINERVNLGGTYRSGMRVEFDSTGKATQILTGNTQFDDLQTTLQPFGQDLPVATEIEFPDSASIGVGWQINDKFYLGADAEWTDWKTIRTIDLKFTSYPPFTSWIDLDLDATIGYRVGFEWTGRRGSQWRAGYSLDETPLPDGVLSPFLMDSDRQTLSLGFGRDWLQMALQWIVYDDRRDTSANSILTGEFGGEAWQFALTVQKKPDPIPVRGPKQR